MIKKVKHFRAHARSKRMVEQRANSEKFYNRTKSEAREIFKNAEK